MTSGSRAKSPRRGRRSVGQLVLAGLTVLGIVASVFLILSNSVQLLRLGLVIALWGVVLGAIAMTKYRRESALDRAKARDLQTVYELQLEREIAARREFEMGVETRVRQEVGGDAREIAALRVELAALRHSLQTLFDGELPVDRTALRADSTRIGELDAGPRGSYQHAPSGLYVPGAGRPQVPSYAPDQPDAPRFADPYDAPVTAETAVIPAVGSADRAETDPNLAPVADESVTDAEVAEVEPEVEPEESLPDPTPGSRRHRRAAGEEAEQDPAGLHSTGLSVAEIMANLSAESPVGSGGRSRRREA